MPGQVIFLAVMSLVGAALSFWMIRVIGFAGPRVIEQTTRQKLPEGFQRSEFLLQHGFLDAVVERKNLKSYLVQALGWMAPATADARAESVAS